MNAKLRVRVQPGARMAGLDGRTADGAVKVKVREPAREGRANEAVSDLLAQHLRVPRRAVQVVRGMTSRDKVVDVQGLSIEALEARIDEALKSGEGNRKRR